MSLNSATGVSNWQLGYYNTYVNYYGIKNSIVMGPSPYLYLCSSTYDYYASYTTTAAQGGVTVANGYETKIARIPTSGAASSVLNREYTFGSYDMNDCSMTYNTADGSLFVSTGSTGY